MPNPNDKSRLAHQLSKATGMTVIYVYRLIKAGRRPLRSRAARAWDRVVDRARSRGVVVAGAVSSTCPQDGAAGVQKAGRS